jgi:AraC-like DNA-binding protein
MEPNWLIIVIFFGIIQSAFMLFLIRKKIKTIAHPALFGILAILLLLQSEAFLMRLDQFSFFVHFMNIATPMIFLLGPLLYLYVQSQLGKSTSFKQYVIHGLPFLLYFLYSFNFYLQPTAVKHNAAVMGFHPNLELWPAIQSFPFDPWNIQGIVVVELLTLHLLAYCILSFIVIRKAKKEPTKHIKKKTDWLFYMTIIMTAGGLIMFFAQGGIINGKVFLKSPFPGYSADISSTIAMYLMMIYFLLRPEVYKMKGNKYENSSLSASYKKEKLKQLTALIEVEKLYLDSGFSMQSLSKKSGLSTHHISQILNEELQLSFFELTNNYRINEAKELLRNSNGFMKMEQLAYDLGYKSKSTFFTAFKKSTNLTPLKYKNSLS